MSIITLDQFRSVETMLHGTETIIKRLDGVPVFTTAERATLWGESIGLVDYHKHTFQGRDYYMPGKDHNDSVSAVRKGIKPSGTYIEKIKAISESEQAVVIAQVPPPILPPSLPSPPPPQTSGGY